MEYTPDHRWLLLFDAQHIFAEHFGRTMPGAWRQLRETIADDVITHGWNERVGAYTVAYGEDDLDAACLFMGLSGLVNVGKGALVLAFASEPHKFA